MRYWTNYGLLVLFFASCITGTQAKAQDILSSTGTSARSYNYIEVQYLFSEADDDDNVPIVFSGLLDLTSSFALRGEYTSQDGSVPENGTAYASIDAYNVGLLYHNRLLGFRNTDWFAEFATGRVTGTRVANSGEETTDSAALRLAAIGLRQTVARRLELQASLRWFDLKTGPLPARTTVSWFGTAVIRVFKNFDLALGINDVGTANNSRWLGFRFTW